MQERKPEGGVGRGWHGDSRGTSGKPGTRMSRRRDLRGMGRGEGILQREWWAASTEDLRGRPCG